MYRWVAEMYSGGVSLAAGLDGGNTMIFAAGKNVTNPIIRFFAEGFFMGEDEMQRVILSQTFLLVFDMMSPLKFLYYSSYPERKTLCWNILLNYS